MAAEIFVTTHNLNHTQWLIARRSGIGGSDVPKIALPNYKYGSQATVYIDKTSDDTPNDESPSEAAEIGTDLEDYVAYKFTQRTGKKVRRKHAILRHKDYPWMLANVDRLVVGEESGLECKTASEYLKDDWVDDEVPTPYYLQCQHYMAVTGYQRWYIAVLVGGNKFKWKLIERDEEVIQHLIRIEGDFWNKNVVPRVPPLLDGSDASTELVNKMYPNMVDHTDVALPSEAEQLVQQYCTWSEAEKEAKAQKTEAANRLKQLMGTNKFGTVGNHKVVWNRYVSNRFNSDQFKKDHPDLYALYLKPSETSRFDVK